MDLGVCQGSSHLTPPVWLGSVQWTRHLQSQHMNQGCLLLLGSLMVFLVWGGHR